MPVLTVRPALSDADRAAARAVRQAVFVVEQGVPPELEWDAHDDTAHHLVAVLDGAAVGAARWRLVGPDAAKLERFAVLASARGRGVGAALVRRALDDARAAGVRRFVLHAQAAVEGFYVPFGFARVGEAFSEAGIEHVKMTWEAPAPDAAP